MQTFLPYPNFYASAGVLDDKRLGKQRVEAMQILRILNGLPSSSGKPYKGWKNHPAVLMWSGYEPALALYFNVISKEWEKRGFKHNMGYVIQDYYDDGKTKMPWWLESPYFTKFCDSHKAALLFKNPEWYSQFKWGVTPELNYWWPSKEIFVPGRDYESS